MRKYRKKPVIIEAIKYDGENKVEVQEFVGKYLDSTGKKQLKIDTLEGTMLANIGDYIIRGVNGEFYPCKPDIFEKTYEKIRTKMSKVYIEGFKMPKSCKKCPFFIFYGKDKFNLCKVGDFSMAMYKGKHPNCPLREMEVK